MQESQNLPPVVVLCCDQRDRERFLACCSSIRGYELCERLTGPIPIPNKGQIAVSTDYGKYLGLLSTKVDRSALFVRFAASPSDIECQANDSSLSEVDLLLQNVDLFLEHAHDVVRIDSREPEDGVRSMWRRLDLVGDISVILQLLEPQTAENWEVDPDACSDLMGQSGGHVKTRVLEQRNRELLSELKRLNRSRGMQMIRAWQKSRKSPMAMAAFPWSLLKIIFSRGRTPEGGDALDLVARAARAVESKDEKRIHREFAELEKRGDADDVRAFGLVKANMSLDEDSEWLNCVNKYLNCFDLDPIRLRDSVEPRFYRIERLTSSKQIDGSQLISVIMPAYNAESTLKLSAESILNQSLSNLQLIIIDDASNDATLAVANELAKKDQRVQVISNTRNVGPYVSKNRGVKVAKGDFITGHDADDWAHPQRLERQLKFFDDPKVDVNIASMIRMREDGKIVRFSRKGPNSPDGAMRVAFISAMFRASFFRKKLAHWDSVRYAADSEIMSRAKSILSPEAMPLTDEPLMLCLELPGSITSHPETGISAEGLSPSRFAYRAAWVEWHERLSPASEETCLDMLHMPRKFEAPKQMVVSSADIEACESDQLGGLGSTGCSLSL